MNASDYPFVSAETVRFRDMDAFGHINNAVYLTYLETARTEFFRQIFAGNTPSQKNFPVILGEISCRYHAPGFYPDTLAIGLGAASFGRKSFTLQAVIESSQGHTLATSTATVVMYDYAAEKTFLVPDWLKEKVAQLQGEWSAETA